MDEQVPEPRTAATKPEWVWRDGQKILIHRKIDAGDQSGEFSRPGWSGLKAEAIALLRGLFARAHVKEHPDGDYLTVHDNYLSRIGVKAGQAIRVHYVNDRHGGVDVRMPDGTTKRQLVSWERFADELPGDTVPRVEVPQVSPNRTRTTEGAGQVTANRIRSEGGVGQAVISDKYLNRFGLPQGTVVPVRWLSNDRAEITHPDGRTRSVSWARFDDRAPDVPEMVGHAPAGPSLAERIEQRDPTVLGEIAGLFNHDDLAAGYTSAVSDIRTARRTSTTDIDGVVRDPRSRIVGWFIRKIEVDRSGAVVLRSEGFHLNREDRGHGVGGAFVSTTMSKALQLGVDYATVTARSGQGPGTDIGAYAWAKGGLYDWDPAHLAEVRRIGRMMRAIDPVSSIGAALVEWDGQSTGGVPSPLDVASDPVGARVLKGDHGPVNWHGRRDVSGRGTSRPTGPPPETLGSAPVGVDGPVAVVLDQARAVAAWERTMRWGVDDPAIAADVHEPPTVTDELVGLADRLFSHGLVEHPGFGWVDSIPENSYLQSTGGGEPSVEFYGGLFDESGDEIGSWRRSLSVVDGLVTMDHETMSLDQSAQGYGVGRAFLTASLDAYRALGIDDVRTQAVSNGNHNGAYCVPMRARMLTQGGWKRWDEINPATDLAAQWEDGFLRWKPVEGVFLFGEKETITFGNRDWWFTATANHKILASLGQKAFPELVRLDELIPKFGTESKARLVTSAPLDAVDRSGLTADQAALLGWLVTDGWVNIRNRRGYTEISAGIAQSKEIGRKEITALLERLGGWSGRWSNTATHAPAAHVRAIYAALGIPIEAGAIKAHLQSAVLRMGHDQIAAFTHAAELAEGNSSAFPEIDGSYRSTVRRRRMSQVSGDCNDALRLGFFLAGNRVGKSRPKSTGSADNWAVSLPTVTTRRLSVSSRQTEEVWCPKTVTGTWVCELDGIVTITGNTWAVLGFDWAAEPLIRKSDTTAVGQRMLAINPNSAIGRTLAEWDGVDLTNIPTPLDVAADPVGAQVLKGNVSWWGHYPLTGRAGAVRVPTTPAGRAKAGVDDLGSAPVANPAPETLFADPNVGSIIEAFNEVGHPIYVVGGAVRSMLMGEPAADIDLTTSATPDLTTALLDPLGAVYPLGERHGTVAVNINGTDYEVTTFRTEQYSPESRQPTVQFADTLEEDLGRRDFTFNAMAVGPDRQIIDPFGGRADLAAGVVRAVGDPVERFSEDPLRIARAVRFAATMGFDIAPETVAAAQVSTGRLPVVSKERFGAELDKILKSPRHGVIDAAVGWAERIGVTDALFGPLALGASRMAAAGVDVAPANRLAALVLWSGTDAAPLVQSMKRGRNEMKAVGRLVDAARTLREGGVPGRVVRSLTDGELDSLRDIAPDVWTPAAERAFANRTVLRGNLPVNGDTLRRLGYEGHEIGAALDRILTTFLARDGELSVSDALTAVDGTAPEVAYPLDEIRGRFMDAAYGTEAPLSEVDATRVATALFAHRLGDGYASEVSDVTIREFDDSTEPQFAVEGAIMHDGRWVGQWVREVGYDRSSGSINVHHDELSISADHQGRGVGSRFVRASIDAYRAAGFDEVKVGAASTAGDDGMNGAYTWATIGFDWDLNDETTTDRVRQIGRAMLAVSPDSNIGRTLADFGPFDGPDEGYEADWPFPTPLDVAADPTGAQVLKGGFVRYGGGDVTWMGSYRLQEPNRAPVTERGRLKAAGEPLPEPTVEPWTGPQVGDRFGAIAAMGEPAPGWEVDVTDGFGDPWTIYGDIDGAFTFPQDSYVGSFDTMDNRSEGPWTVTAVRTPDDVLGSAPTEPVDATAKFVKLTETDFEEPVTRALTDVSRLLPPGRVPDGVEADTLIDAWDNAWNGNLVYDGLPGPQRWANSTRGMHRAAAAEFGRDAQVALIDKLTAADKSTAQAELDDLVADFGPEDSGSVVDTVDQVRAVMRARYDGTQEALRAAGIGPNDTITLYRGVSNDQRQEWEAAGRPDRVVSAPLAAFTTDMVAAAEYGTTRQPFLAGPEAPRVPDGMVIAVPVRAGDILAAGNPRNPDETTALAPAGDHGFAIAEALSPADTYLRNVFRSRDAVTGRPADPIRSSQDGQWIDGKRYPVPFAGDHALTFGLEAYGSEGVRPDPTAVYLSSFGKSGIIEQQALESIVDAYPDPQGRVTNATIPGGHPTIRTVTVKLPYTVTDSNLDKASADAREIIADYIADTRIRAAGKRPETLGSASTLEPVAVATWLSRFGYNPELIGQPVGGWHLFPTKPGELASWLRKESWEGDEAAAIEAARSTLAEVAADAIQHGIVLRVPEQTIEQILEDGRYRTQHEVGDSLGDYDPAGRQRYEQQAFGWTEYAERPVYGLVPTGRSSVVAGQPYGYSGIRLRPDAVSRSTVSLGDSLGTSIPVPFSSVTVATPEQIAAATPRSGFRKVLNAQINNPEGFGSSYVEAQVHGGVDLADFAELIAFHPDDAETLAPLAEEYGIPLRVTWTGDGADWPATQAKTWADLHRMWAEQDAAAETLGSEPVRPVRSLAALRELIDGPFDQTAADAVVEGLGDLFNTKLDDVQVVTQRAGRATGARNGVRVGGQFVSGWDGDVGDWSVELSVDPSGDTPVWTVDISNVALDEAARGNGLGPRFVAAVETAARKAGVAEATITAVTDPDSGLHGARVAATLGYDWDVTPESVAAVQDLADRLLEDDEDSWIGQLLDGWDGTIYDGLPTPLDVAADEAGADMLDEAAVWYGRKSLQAPNRTDLTVEDVTSQQAARSPIAKLLGYGGFYRPFPPAVQASIEGAVRGWYNLDLGDGYQSKISKVTFSRNSAGDDPVVVDGNIYSEDGTVVGSWTRTLRRASLDDPTEAAPVDDFEAAVVNHDLFRLDPAHQGAGLGSRFFAQTIDRYRLAGVPGVITQATSTPPDTGEDPMVGALVWARRGFEWGPANGEDAENVAELMLGLDPRSNIARMIQTSDGLDDAEFPSPLDIAADPVGRRVLAGETGPVSWAGWFPLDRAPRGPVTEAGQAAHTPVRLIDTAPELGSGRPSKGTYEWDKAAGRAFSAGRVTRAELAELGAGHDVMAAIANQIAGGHIDQSPGDDGWRRVPDRMWHVTTAADQVMADRLRTSFEVGQRGLGGSSSEISLASDLGHARAIYDGLLEAVAVARGEVTVRQLVGRATIGDRGSNPFVGDPWFAGTVRFETDQPDWMPSDPVPDVAPEKTLEVWRAFAQVRQNAGGPRDPFIMTSASALVGIDPAQVAILELAPNGETWGVPLATRANAADRGEWRIPTGDAVQIVGRVDPVDDTLGSAPAGRADLGYDMPFVYDEQAAITKARGVTVPGLAAGYDSEWETRKLVVNAYRSYIADPSFADTPVMVFSSSAFPRIIEAGRYLPQHVSGRSNGMYNPEYRERWETDYLGVPAGHPGVDRPVFGTIMEPDSISEAAEWYGDAMLVLRPDRVAGRVSFTFGDSLDTGAVPLWVSDVETASDDRLAAAVSTEGVPYIETQIHGGVTLDDVAVVVFRHRKWDPDSSWDGTPLADLERQLADAGHPGVKVAAVPDLGDYFYEHDPETLGSAPIRIPGQIDLFATPEPDPVPAPDPAPEPLPASTPAATVRVEPERPAGVRKTYGWFQQRISMPFTVRLADGTEATGKWQSVDGPSSLYPSGLVRLEDGTRFEPKDVEVLGVGEEPWADSGYRIKVGRSDYRINPDGSVWSKTKAGVYNFDIAPATQEKVRRKAWEEQRALETLATTPPAPETPGPEVQVDGQRQPDSETGPVRVAPHVGPYATPEMTGPRPAQVLRDPLTVGATISQPNEMPVKAGVVYSAVDGDGVEWTIKHDSQGRFLAAQGAATTLPGSDVLRLFAHGPITVTSLNTNQAPQDGTVVGAEAELLKLRQMVLAQDATPHRKEAMAAVAWSDVPVAAWIQPWVQRLARREAERKELPYNTFGYLDDWGREGYSLLAAHSRNVAHPRQVYPKPFYLLEVSGPSLGLYGESDAGTTRVWSTEPPTPDATPYALSTNEVRAAVFDETGAPRFAWTWNKPADRFTPWGEPIGSTVEARQELVDTMDVGLVPPGEMLWRDSADLVGLLLKPRSDNGYASRDGFGNEQVKGSLRPIQAVGIAADGTVYPTLRPGGIPSTDAAEAAGIVNFALDDPLLPAAVQAAAQRRYGAQMRETLTSFRSGGHGDSRMGDTPVGDYAAMLSRRSNQAKIDLLDSGTAVVAGAVRVAAQPDGTWTPDPDGDPLTESEWEAAFIEPQAGGGYKIWLPGEMAAARLGLKLDYTQVADSSLPFEQRVAALGEQRRILQRMLSGSSPKEWFGGVTPNQETVESIAAGDVPADAVPYLRRVMMLETFGVNTHQLVAERVAELAAAKKMADNPFTVEQSDAIFRAVWSDVTERGLRENVTEDVNRFDGDESILAQIDGTLEGPQWTVVETVPAKSLGTDIAGRDAVFSVRFSRIGTTDPDVLVSFTPSTNNDGDREIKRATTNPDLSRGFGERIPTIMWRDDHLDYADRLWDVLNANPPASKAPVAVVAAEKPKLVYSPEITARVGAKILDATNMGAPGTGGGVESKLRIAQITGDDGTITPRLVMNGVHTLHLVKARTGTADGDRHATFEFTLYPDDPSAGKDRVVFYEGGTVYLYRGGGRWGNQFRLSDEFWEAHGGSAGVFDAMVGLVKEVQKVDGPAKAAKAPKKSDLHGTGEAVPDGLDVMRVYHQVMEAIGIDMGSDQTLRVAQAGMSNRLGPLADAKPKVRQAVELGLLAFPKSWTTKLAQSRAVRVRLRTKMGGRYAGVNYYPGGGTGEHPDADTIVTVDPDVTDAYLSTWGHEFGHSMQRSIPGLHEAERWYLASRLSRTGDPKKRKPRKYDRSKRSKSFIYDDDLGDTYAARTYSGQFDEARAFEVITVGVQGLYENAQSRAASRDRFNSDPRLAGWAIGMMAAYDPTGDPTVVDAGHVDVDGETPEPPEMVVHPTRGLADYVTPAVDRWAAKLADRPGYERLGFVVRLRELAATTGGGEAGEPNESARRLFEGMFWPTESRIWIDDTLSALSPDPDAVETLRQAHLAAVHELGDDPHPFVRSSNDLDPFADGAAVGNISIATPRGLRVTSWYRTDGPFERAAPPTSHGSHIFNRSFTASHVVANIGDMMSIGEYLIAESPEIIDRLMAGEFPIVDSDTPETLGSAPVSVSLAEATEGWADDLSMEITHAATDLLGLTRADGWSGGTADPWFEGAARVLIDAVNSSPVPNSLLFSGHVGSHLGPNPSVGTEFKIPLMATTTSAEMADGFRTRSGDEGLVTYRIAGAPGLLVAGVYGERPEFLVSGRFEVTAVAAEANGSQTIDLAYTGLIVPPHETLGSVPVGGVMVVPAAQAGVRDRRRVLEELDRQGYPGDGPMRGVVDGWPGDHLALARDNDGTIIGAISFDPGGGRGRSDVVLHDLRAVVKRQGVGRLLVMEAARIGKARGATRMALYSGVPGAEAFYRALGAEGRSYHTLTWEPGSFNALAEADTLGARAPVETYWGTSYDDPEDGEPLRSAPEPVDPAAGVPVGQVYSYQGIKILRTASGFINLATGQPVNQYGEPVDS